MKEIIIDSFKKRFGSDPKYLVRAPGRVNLIGDHTDYNDGFVFPLAISYAIWIAFSEGRDRTIEIHSHNFEESSSFTLDKIENTNSGWMEFIKGSASILMGEGYDLVPFKGVIGADLPVGSGLSSSAALETAVIKAFATTSDLKISNKRNAVLGQRVENQWIGMNCGIMDQLASACGEENHALFMDCENLNIIPVSVPDQARVAILDTSTRRKLTASAYNERRNQCETACEEFKIPSLRKISPDYLDDNLYRLEPVIQKRALHVVSENKRVETTKKMLEAGNLSAVGKLLNESHASLRDQYEVSSDALNKISDAANESTGCYGARMTGAGFGGCAVALIDGSLEGQFKEELLRRYSEYTGFEAKIYFVSPKKGVELISI